MSDIDQEVVDQYLDNAVMHRDAKNDWAEGYWLGRALEHVEQNAMDYDSFTQNLAMRGLDIGIVPVPKIEANRG